MITYHLIIEQDRQGKVHFRLDTPPGKATPDEVKLALKFQDLIRQAFFNCAEPSQLAGTLLSNNEGVRQFAKPDVN